MAIELERFLTDQLARLPEDHPDRRLLESLKMTVDAFTGRDPAIAPLVSEPEAPLAAPTEQTPATEIMPEDMSKPEQERVHLHGRLGYPPTFRTTPKGVLVGTAPLAVRGDGAADSVTWWKVFVFRQRAEKLREQNLGKGSSIEVIGYGYNHTLTKRDGTTSIEHRVNAVAVKVR